MSGPGTSRHRSRSGLRALTVAVAAAGLCLGMVPTVASATAPQVLFVASITDCTVSGAAPANKTIKVTWKDSDGSLKHVQTVKSSATGFFQTTCDDSEQVERGDVFTAKIGSSPPRSFTVPALGFHIDRVADTITGKGPALTDLTMAFDGVPTTLTTTTLGDGTFDYDAHGKVDIIGAGRVTVSFKAGQGDIVQRSLQAPYLAAYRGSADIYMLGRPGSVVEVQLFNGSTNLADVDCTVGPTGGCWLTFTDADGHPVRAQTGMRVVSTDIASDADFVIPNVTVTGTPSSDVISGTCLTGNPGAYYVTAWRAAGSGSVSRSGTTNAQGKFSTDVTARFDLRSGDKILEECGLATGDWIERRITVP